MKTTILLIEDNEQNAYLFTFILEKNGYRTCHAADGLAGVEQAQLISPQLILLDIQLPLMDGYEVARTLRTIPSLNDVPIVAITSHAMVGDRETALAAGCNGYIEKPINPETFAKEVATYLAVKTGGNRGTTT